MRTCMNIFYRISDQQDCIPLEMWLLFMTKTSKTSQGENGALVRSEKPGFFLVKTKARTLTTSTQTFTTNTQSDYSLELRYSHHNIT